MVSELQFTDNKLVAFLRIDAFPAPTTCLTHSFRVGDTVTKLAFDLQPSNHRPTRFVWQLDGLRELDGWGSFPTVQERFLAKASL